ncbi:MAG: NADH-ubiquinone oxidoreductase-F iron-sulfur binding region domain-containing protein [Smithellaceae bacterium]|nr:NADH-ubiquinone oxidoreductase-F iron-sulfur binding region domain-containing protein [Smithellaceae bacterium]
MSKINTREALDKAAKKGLSTLIPAKIKITVGMSTSGIASGAQGVYDALAAEIKKRKLSILLTKTGSMGMDCMEPLIDVMAPGKPRLSYAMVTAAKVPQLMDEIAKGTLEPIRPFYRTDGEQSLITGEKIKFVKGALPKELKEIPEINEVPFYKKQIKIATRNCGIIDPENIDEYIARGGYSALAKALTQKPDKLIDDVIASGLRGRGGGGFPTGVKWRSCREAEGDIKYVICNGDEGDPGAYMDRSVMEGDPHSVLEGMIIGAYAVGAHEGFIYVRNEYPLAVANLSKAIEQARANGFLGKNIFGSGFDFDIRIAKGAGAFVCGESTALMASLEGKAGEPRAKYIHTVEHGLWNRPSNLNNVETWANVPVVIARGGKWFAGIGSKESTGTKVFSLVGNVKNVGLVEVPMGIPLKEIVNDIGGGIPGGRKFKAVQTGGPSGGCIPAKLGSLPVTYDELSKAGSMMGSGGMIVMDDKTCMVDIARYFIEFLESESCGKCVPCREGVKRMRDILEDICKGKGKEGDVELLQSMSQAIIDGSLCALGGSAPNPVLSTIKYFRDEYDAHIKEKRCPAGVCKPLITYSVLKDKCTGCMRCAKVCPTKAATGEKKKTHKINKKLCIKCGACLEACKFGAIKVE